MEVEIIALAEGGDIQSLMTIEFPQLPRRGDTIELHGDEFGDEHNSFDVFEVNDVIWQADKTGVHHVQVSVNIPSHQYEYVPRCTCTAERQKPRPDGRCDDCNGRIVVRRK